jgi:hypothetical protein
MQVDPQNIDPATLRKLQSAVLAGEFATPALLG